MRFLKTLFAKGKGAQSACYSLNKISFLLFKRYSRFNPKMIKFYFFNHLYSLSLESDFKPAIKDGLQYIPFEIIKEKKLSSKYPEELAMLVEIVDRNDHVFMHHKITMTRIGEFVMDDDEDEIIKTTKEGYTFSSFKQMEFFFCYNKDISYYELAVLFETKAIIDRLFSDLEEMARDRIKLGFKRKGKILNTPDSLEYQSKKIFDSKPKNETHDMETIRLITSYCYAMGEILVSEKMINSVRFPTPVAYNIFGAIIYLIDKYKPSDKEKYNAFAAMGLWCSLYVDLVRPLSFLVGCENALAAATGMVAIFAYMIIYKDTNPKMLSRCFEMAIEHSLGIVCINPQAPQMNPCIDRYAAFGVRAVEIANLVYLTKDTPDIVLLDDAILAQNDTWDNNVSIQDLSRLDRHILTNLKQKNKDTKTLNKDSNKPVSKNKEKAVNKK